VHDRPCSQNPHDSLFGGVFCDPLRTGEVLRSALPPPVARAIDWASLGRVDRSFVDEELRRHRSDLLFTAQCAGRPVLLYLLVEHKSRDERFTALQMTRYMLRIWEAWRAENPTATHLPPIVPFVLSHGTSPWRSPRDLRHLIDLDGLPAELAALQPQAPFVLDDLGAQSEADLHRRRLGIQSLLTLLYLQQLRRHAETAVLLLRWRHLHLRLLAEPGGQAILHRLLRYVAAVSNDDHERLRAAYDRIHTPTASQFMTVADQLRQEGRIEARIETLLIQLDQRFGPLPPTATARIRAADEPTLDRWIRRVLTAPSLDDLLA
jgi:hypothetical protein